MAELSVTLALVNFLPIAFSAVAFVFIAGLVRQSAPDWQWLAWVGGGLVVLGALAKASWKLIVATTGADITWLASALFPLLAPGFALAAGAALAVLRARKSGTKKGIDPGWLALTVILIAFGAAGLRTWLLEIPRGWFLPLMTLTTIGNLALSLILIRLAARCRSRLAIALLIANLATVFALPPIAMIEPKGIAIHWLEQTLTASGTAAFALAAYLLLRLARNGCASSLRGSEVS